MERVDLGKLNLGSRIKVQYMSDAYSELAVKFPYFQTVKDTTSLNPFEMHNWLMSQRLLLRDSHINIDRYCFRLTEVFYPRSSERKRINTKNSKTITPSRECDSEGIFKQKPIRVDQVTAEIDKLNPGHIRNCGNQIVVKGRLIAVVKLLNRVLVATTEESKSRSPFDDNRLRLKVVTSWVNWIFHHKYKVSSSFTHEQVRQMIKRKNIHGGHIEITPPNFN